MVGLTACAAGTELVGDQSRAVAKSVVLPIVEERVPGPEAVLIADCVIENAETTEILSLVKDAATGPDSDTVWLVFEIAKRPGTLKCLATSGLAPLLT